MRKPIAQRIKELEERKRSLQSRLDRQERAQATRRKILLGSLVLERLAQDDDWYYRRSMRSEAMACGAIASVSRKRCRSGLVCGFALRPPAIAYAR
ncbi:hypothetical protein [Agrobacterium rosae]|uniref:Mobilization protein n=1 Tax=Agrobacterium rosae TaxID=1972867 RepID=A0AAW9FSW2_9HYPH|nr:hypothetical protein [Agrobacterium rosae]MDX8305950.1 hypothetical protein [Agrobacterium rosae]